MNSLMEELNAKKRSRDDESEEPESNTDSPEVKRLRENLLDGLDDDTEFCTASLDLDSFMKSFEKEICASPSTDAVAVEVVDLVSESGESQPELGYLLEASDDDLGLPPTTSSTGVVEKSDIGADLWGFETEIPSYDSYGFGLIQTENFNGGNGEYVAIDGLFDYSDMGGYGSSDFSWRPETLPAQ